jgi:XTP/dITP diphosphohydrolase
MDLVLATRNKKKLEEIKRITKNMDIMIFTLDDFPGCPEVDEDSSTFEGNAIKKAVTVAKYSGKPALADDSGLEVDALGGEPGVFSARYAGYNADDTKNMQKLLKEMKTAKEREARFVCCIAIALPRGNVEVFLGYAEGIIGIEPKGSNGFGYDPVFYPKGHTKTFAEMSDEEKDSLSHRGKALRKLQEYLSNRLKNLS